MIDCFDDDDVDCCERAMPGGGRSADGASRGVGHRRGCFQAMMVAAAAAGQDEEQ